MALPASFDKVTVTNSYVDLEGKPGKGKVTFTPVVTEYLKSVDTKWIIIPTPISVELDSQGSFTVDLPYTNDPEVIPSFVYMVKEEISGLKRNPFAIELDVDLIGPVVLSDLTPVGIAQSGTTILTRELADILYAPAGETGGGAAELTSYIDQVKSLPDYPTAFPPITGTTTGTAAEGNDVRLSDQRVPTDGSVSLVKLNALLQGSIAKADESLNQAEVDQRVQQIVNAAPAALDTLAELADALNNDPDFAATITAQLATKANLSGGKVPIAELPVGTTAGTIKAGNWLPGYQDLQGTPDDDSIPQDAVAGLEESLGTKASTSLVLEQTGDKIVVYYTKAGWGTAPIVTGDQWREFRSDKLRPESDPTLTEADLINAPEPPWDNNDSWYPHPESPVVATLVGS